MDDVGLELLSYLDRSGLDYKHEGDTITIGPISVTIGAKGAEVYFLNAKSWIPYINNGEPSRLQQNELGGRTKNSGGKITVIRNTNDSSKVISYIDNLLTPSKRMPNSVGMKGAFYIRADLAPRSLLDIIAQQLRTLLPKDKVEVSKTDITLHHSDGKWILRAGDLKEAKQGEWNLITPSQEEIIFQAPDAIEIAKKVKAKMTLTVLKKIGYWRLSKNVGDSDIRMGTHEFPWPEDLIDENWDQIEKARVVLFLKSGKVKTSYRGWSKCRICGQNNGSRELYQGNYMWPDGFAHYVEIHSVKPDEEFLEFVRSRQ